jgi:cation diffusion facilitator CzcD-associated flavoprotein CzcO
MTVRPGSPTVAILGTGVSGIGMALELARAGIRSFTLFEREGRIGGTWRDNTYPGAACDIPSHLYSFSHEPNPRWSHRYAPQAEILAYLERCATKHDLHKHVRFGSEIAAMTFDPSARWTLTDAAGGEHRADVVVTGCGQLSRPRVPDLPGRRRRDGRERDPDHPRGRARREAPPRRAADAQLGRPAP